MGKIQPFPGFQVNGHDVIAARPFTDHPDEDCRVVLVDLEREYVTWVIGPMVTPCWGHYFAGTDAGYSEAYSDFLTR